MAKNIKAAKADAAKPAKAKPVQVAQHAAQAAAEPLRPALPAHVTVNDERRLDVADIEGRTMCDPHGLTRFRRGINGADFTTINTTTWVEQQMRLVPDRWVKRLAYALSTVHQGDLRWAAKNLLPEGWAEIYTQAVNDALREAGLDQRPGGGDIRRGNYRKRMKVRLATFAALYVEAGRPD